MSKRISLTSSTILEEPCLERKGKNAWEYGGFHIASSPKSCSIEAWTNCVNVAGVRVGIKTAADKCIKVFLVYNKANAY
jgi:hypothetical protein